jgi:hypothetical protein
MYFHMNAWTNLHIVGQPDTFLAAGTSVRRMPYAEAMQWIGKSWQGRDVITLTFKRVK